MVGISSLSAGSLPEIALRAAEGKSQAQMAPADGGDFSAMLRQMAGEAVGSVRQGEAAALAGIHGGLPLQTIVERVMAAERTLQAALAVRDKAVSSYLEISRMQI
jgi:flagellar hook-basal body complex protein FliE